jgi:hypothetical protein
VFKIYFDPPKKKFWARSGDQKPCFELRRKVFGRLSSSGLVKKFSERDLRKKLF